MRIAYMALQEALRGKSEKTDGFTPRAAPVPGFRAGLVREYGAAGGQEPRYDRCARAWVFPRQRNGGEHARIPEGVFV
jgi:hypothetical protein